MKQTDAVSGVFAFFLAKSVLWCYNQTVNVNNMSATGQRHAPESASLGL